MVTLIFGETKVIEKGRLLQMESTLILYCPKNFYRTAITKNTTFFMLFRKMRHLWCNFAHIKINSVYYVSKEVPLNIQILAIE